jgi:DNA-binding transcriptional LysR family regulator
MYSPVEPSRARRPLRAPALRASETVVRVLSFRNAAGELCVTKSAVSHGVVPALEDHLGLRLLIPRLAGFHRRHPEIDVCLDATVEAVDLARTNVDLAVRYGHENVGAE